MTQNIYQHIELVAVFSTLTHSSFCLLIFAIIMHLQKYSKAAKAIIDDQCMMSKKLYIKEYTP